MHFCFKFNDNTSFAEVSLHLDMSTTTILTATDKYNDPFSASRYVIIIFLVIQHLMLVESTFVDDGIYQFS